MKYYYSLLINEQYFGILIYGYKNVYDARGGIISNFVDLKLFLPLGKRGIEVKLLGVPGNRVILIYNILCMRMVWACTECFTWVEAHLRAGEIVSILQLRAVIVSWK